MIAATWDLCADSKQEGELPPIRYRVPAQVMRQQRRWRVVMWARGQDGWQLDRDLRTPTRCTLEQIVVETATELLEIAHKQSPLVKAGMRVEICR